MCLRLLQPDEIYIFNAYITCVCLVFVCTASAGESRIVQTLFVSPSVPRVGNCFKQGQSGNADGGERGVGWGGEKGCVVTAEKVTL